MMNITMEINFSSKVYSKSLLKGSPLSCTSLEHILSRSMEADILKSKKDLYLVQKYGGRYFEKVKRIDILSRSMEADILKSKKDLYLVQKYGGRYFERVMFINLFYSAHRHNCLFHYRGCGACHQNS